METIINNLNASSADLMNELNVNRRIPPMLRKDRFEIIFEIEFVEMRMEALIDEGKAVLADDVDTAMQIEAA